MAVDELASHQHLENLDYHGKPTPFVSTNGTAPRKAGYYIQDSALSSSTDNVNHTNSTGGNTAHNNMQPALATYAWRRQA